MRLPKAFSLILLSILSITITYTVKNIINDNNVELIQESQTVRLYEDNAVLYRDRHRMGYGERGIGVRFWGEEQRIAETYVTQNGFNIYISDKVPLDRSVADLRYPECRVIKYSKRLPETSVIIPFFEEHVSTLLRTIMGILTRSPPGVIKEVILVDDGSSREYLKNDLDRYILQYFPSGIVRIVRLPVREGLIRARIHGAKAAKYEILVFIDSHCEPSHNWLPPLLDPISKNYKTVTCPFIDKINAETFRYHPLDEGRRGAFDWELTYRRLPRLPEDGLHREKPFKNPIMMGGLFAISARWFWELGGYDPGLRIYGGEQFELSFKVWMCGGNILDVPCSRIGHIFRSRSTNFPKNAVPSADYMEKNYKRVAEVWMDEYKKNMYFRRPDYRNLDPGNLTEQHSIRKRLKCKSFKWFLTEIAFDVLKAYPPVDPIRTATGYIRPVSGQSLCIDGNGASAERPVRLRKCIPNVESSGGLQNLEFKHTADIRFTGTSKCLDAPNAFESGAVVAYTCHGQMGNQYWSVETIHGDKKNPLWIRHVITGYCLAACIVSRRLLVRYCKQDSVQQHWIWETFQPHEAADSHRKAGLVV